MINSDIWIRAITQPTLENYEGMLKEEPTPELTTPLMWVAIAAAIGAAISGFLRLLFGLFGNQSFGQLIGGWVGGIVLAPIIAIIAFFIGAGLFYFIAKQFFGGTGTFSEQAYLLGAAQAPMSIISSIVASIPFVGPLLVLPLSLYAVWLNILAIQASHKVTTGKAAATVLIPVLLLFLCACCLAFSALSLLSPEIENIFEEIQRELQAP